MIGITPEKIYLIAFLKINELSEDEIMIIYDSFVYLIIEKTCS